MLEVKDVNQFYGGSHIYVMCHLQRRWVSVLWCLGAMAWVKPHS